MTRSGREAEMKYKAEVKRIAEEAWKAETVAEGARVAKAKVEKEEDEKIQVANKAMKEGLLAIVADKKRAAEEAACLNVLTLAKCPEELAKLGVPPGDPLMQAPKGPGPSRQELQQIQHKVAVKPKKWKLREAEILVCFLKSRDSVRLT
jgi:hypothetical protein